MVAGLLALSLGLGACSGDHPQPKIAPPESSAPTSGSPSAEPGPVEPTMPAAAKRHDAAGAEAFVEYYWELVNYAQATGEVAQLRQVALKSCSACSGGLRGIVDTYEAGGSITGGEIEVVTRRASPFSAGPRSGFTVTVIVATTAQTVKAPGKRTKHLDPGRTKIQLVVQRTRANWMIGRWDVLT
nr:DUF6318 family protein [Nocardioides luti]